MNPEDLEKLKETMDAQTSGTEPGTSDSEPSPSGSEAEISESSLKIISHGVVWIYKNRPTPLTPGATAAVLRRQTKEQPGQHGAKDYAKAKEEKFLEASYLSKR